MKPPKILMALFLLTVCPSVTVAEEPQEIKKNLIKEQNRLDEVREKIKKKKKALEATARKEKNLLEELGNIETAIDRGRVASRNTGNKLTTLNREIKKKESDIKRLKAEINKREEWLKKRAVALYKFGSIGPAKAVFSSDSYMSLRERSTFMQLILKNDVSTIDDYRSRVAAVDSNLLSLEKDRKKTAALKERLRAEKRETEGELNKKKRLLSSISRSKTLHEQAIKEMKASSRDMEKMIVKFEDLLKYQTDPGAGIAFSSLKGHLDFPAEGDIVAFFGETKDPKFNTTIFQKGIDIAVPEGTEIKAIFAGKVLYADWFRGYGKIIIIDHGGGYYSLSAHVSKIIKKVGALTKKGEIIALAGDTGSLKGPYLYFEIREKGKPVDPLKWLKAPLKSTDKRADNRRKR